MNNSFLSLLSLAEYVMGMDPKLVFIIIAFIFGIASFIVYVKDEVWGDTEPHPISWFIWLIAQAIALVSMVMGGGGYGAWYGAFYCFTITTILLITLFKYGLRDVTRTDVVCLIICLIGIIASFWFQTPLIALLLGTGVDAYGFEPSFRKASRKPWSESLWGWGLMIPNYIFTILALENYNELTLTYPLVMLVLTTALVVLCAVKRRSISKPEGEGEQ